MVLPDAGRSRDDEDGRDPEGRLARQGRGLPPQRAIPGEKTSVIVTRLRPDDANGRVIFQVSAKHGDRVHYEEGGSPATINSPLVQNGRLETTALRVSFLAIDSSGEHETGDPRVENNTITLKYDCAYRDGARCVTLKAIPKGTIRYTLDGSNPRNGGVCDTGEVVVPQGRDMLLAIAEAEVPMANGGDGSFEPDLTRPADWRRRLKTSDRGRAFKILECLKRHRATTAGADINVALSGRSESYIAMAYGPNVTRTADAIENIAVDLVGQLAGDGEAVDVTLAIASTHFDSGAALIETAKELEEPLVADEVRQ